MTLQARHLASNCIFIASPCHNLAPCSRPTTRPMVRGACRSGKTSHVGLWTLNSTHHPSPDRSTRPLHYVGLSSERGHSPDATECSRVCSSGCFGLSLVVDRGPNRHSVLNAFSIKWRQRAILAHRSSLKARRCSAWHALNRTRARL